MANEQQRPHPLPPLPRAPVDRLLDPLQHFLHVQAASGVVLLAVTLLALGLANSPLADGYLAFWKTRVGLNLGSFQLEGSLKHWINDGLMAVFFFVIGLEVKRELVLGELREFRNAALPVFAALGGMVVPAGLYLALQHGQPGAPGWGVPMATDIAFVVGCMAVLGPRIPMGLRVLLLSLAIVDDIGAILVIAVGYSDGIDTTALALGFGGIVATLAMARSGVRSVGVYTLVGIAVWLAFHESGVHATVAGVILGLSTPAKHWVGRGLLMDTLQKSRASLGDGAHDDHAVRHAILRQVEVASRESLSPLERIETALHPWVGFVIMPVFALANAGVPVSLDSVGQPVALAVLAGLVLGKPLGVLLFSWLATRTGLAVLPAGVGWGALLGGGLLAGIGFTMALFIADLALPAELLDTAKVGVLVASGLAAVAGMAVLLMTLKQPAGSVEPGGPP